jgi:hypothetical protein
MRFTIDKDYAITRDKYQWILLKNERPFQFFTNLQNLLTSILLFKISDSKASEVNQVIRAIKHAENALCKLSTRIGERFEKENSK